MKGTGKKKRSSFPRCVYKKIGRGLMSSADLRSLEMRGYFLEGKAFSEQFSEIPANGMQGIEGIPGAFLIINGENIAA